MNNIIIGPPFNPIDQGETVSAASGTSLTPPAAPVFEPFNPVAQGQTISSATVNWTPAASSLPSSTTYIGPITMQKNINANTGVINAAINNDTGG